MAPLYVQYGCGFSVGKDWLNFDSSPTLRSERLPVVGGLLGRLIGNSQPFPAAVRHGDICGGLPVADNSVRGVYASHVLEHLSFNDFRTALRNALKILEPGGTFRLIVPDLQGRARRYLEQVANGSPDANSNFLKTTHLGWEDKPRSFLSRVRVIYGGNIHMWMWDEPSIVKQLELAGFVDIRRCELGDSNDPMFAQVEHAGRFVDAALDLRELAVSARKPGTLDARQTK